MSWTRRADRSWEHPLQKDEIHQILEWAKQTDLSAFVYTNTNWYASTEGYWTEYELKISGFKGIVRSFYEIEGNLGTDEKPFKVLCMDKDPEYLSRMERQLILQMGSRFTILRSGPIYLEIFHREWTRGRGQSPRIPLRTSREAIMAVGDYYNDVAMLKAAGYSVAMGNAPDDIKEMADVVTRPNTEDGLALAIKPFYNRSSSRSTALTGKAGSSPYLSFRFLRNSFVTALCGSIPALADTILRQNLQGKSRAFRARGNRPPTHWPALVFLPSIPQEQRGL